MATEHRLLTGAPDPLNREALAWILLGFFALFVIAFYVVRLPGKEQNNRLNPDRATFEAVSAVTLTGLPQDVKTSSFGADNWIVPVTLLAVTIAAGFLTLMATALPACRVLGMPHSIGRIAAAAAMLVVGGTVAGGLVMLGAPSRTWLEAFILSASAVTNSGITWGPLPRTDTWPTHLVLLPLSVVGGLGLPVLLDLFDRAARRTPMLMRHTRLVLLLTVGFYVAGVILLVVTDERIYRSIGLLWSSPEPSNWTSARWRDIRSVCVDAATWSIDARSAGLPFSNASVSSLPRAAQWILLMLMAVGASPAGTGGGLKTATLFALGRGLRQGVNGDRLSPVTGFALAWTAAFVLIVFVGTLGLVWSAPDVPADRLLFLAVSAASNSGLSHDALAIVIVPLMLLALVMIAGRLAPILLLWRLAKRVDHADTVVG